MSTTSISVPAGTPAPSSASPFPAELSHSPLLGILGVLLGAAIASLTGRFLTLGLADLKGNVGIGFDEGTWISSAFNVAVMFIGHSPFIWGDCWDRDECYWLVRHCLLWSAHFFL